jgi:hypothetical protein
VSPRAPDARWFGNSPELIAELRGPDAETAIVRIEEAVAAYPYAHEYRIWPGLESIRSNSPSSCLSRAISASATMG